MRIALVSRRPSSTTLALAGVRVPGIELVALSPEEAASHLGIGDAVVGRLDVRTTLDGIDDGLWALGVAAARGVTVLNAPGTLLASGHSDVAEGVAIGADFGLTRSQVFFNLPSVNLGAGSYFFALNVTSPNQNHYLSIGAASSGAYQSVGGGAWTQKYTSFNSIAVGLYDTARGAAVPEPATWALMIGGFGGVGAAMRRRRQVTV